MRVIDLFNRFAETSTTAADLGFAFLGPWQVREKIIEEDDSPDGELYYRSIDRKCTILGSFDQDGWRGETVLIVLSRRRYGFVALVYGSCSVCDTMLGADGDAKKIAEEAESIMAKCQWFDSLDAMLIAGADRDWEACEAIGMDGPSVKECFKRLRDFADVDWLAVAAEDQTTMPRLDEQGGSI